MPGLKPILKLSEAQRKALLRRIVLKESDQVGELNIPRNAGIDPAAMQGSVQGALDFGLPPAMEAGPLPTSLQARNFPTPTAPATMPGPMGTSLMKPEAVEGIPRYRSGELGDMLTTGMKTGPVNAPMIRQYPTLERLGAQSSEGVPPWSRIDRPIEPSVGPSPIDELLASEPGVEKIMGRLGVEGGVLDYPFAEAKMRYLKNPSAYSLPRPPAEVKRVRATDDIEGVAYERVKWRPVLSSGERNMIKATEQELSKMEIPESAKQVVKPRVDYGQKQSAKAVETVASSSQGKSAEGINVLETAVLADSMWKHLGGGTSANGRMWKMFNDTAADKSKRSNAREYFVARMLEWKSNPEWFKKRYPRESKQLDALWNSYQTQEQGMVQ